jgi:hypothetical protein
MASDNNSDNNNSDNNNNIDADKLAVLEALLCKERERRLGEEPLEIITGVPECEESFDGEPIAKANTALRVEDFSGRRRARETMDAVSKPMPNTPAPRPQRQASVERPDEGPHRIIVQVRPPDCERGDHGEVAEGTYTVAGNVVRVEDMEGRSLGGQVLRPTDDPRVVARAILRTTKTPEPFWNPIPYPTH